MRQPNFENMLKVLNKQKPERPTLFEFFLNQPLYRELAGPEIVAKEDELAPYRILMHAFKNAGYDYATIHPPAGVGFQVNEIDHEKSISLNAYNIIHDRQSFEDYNWCNPDNCNYELYDKLAKELPDGMKIIVCGPGGVLENVIRLIGYDQMCMLTIDNEQLLKDIFDKVGSILVRHYELASQFDSVGALISNDDWGFKTQIMLSPDDFKKYLIPWHVKIAEACHINGKPVILHSCGNLDVVMDSVIDEIKYDGKHSYEDAIIPVEEAYEKWGNRIAIMGGIDLDFICRSTPEQVRQRALNLLEQTAERGSFALGSGNSIPEYIPTENYFAMVNTVKEF